MQTSLPFQLALQRPRGRSHFSRVAIDAAEAGPANPVTAEFEGKKNLVLIGGRGCGKSSICRRIQLVDKRWSLFSLDTLIQYEAGGNSIAQIVADNGWRHFRDLEFTTVTKAASMPQWALIDAGGGVVVDLDESGQEIFSERKVNALKQNAVIIYIKRDVGYLRKRIAKKAAKEATGLDSNRPVLDPTKGFDEIMARRDPWYCRAADLVLDGSDRFGGPIPKEDLAAAVLKWYGEVNPEANFSVKKVEVREHLASLSATLMTLQALLA